MDQDTSSLRETEARNAQSAQLDILPGKAVLSILHEGQVKAADVVSSATVEIAEAANLAASALSAGGNLAYVGAGSSGLMAISDGLELTGTFGIPMDRIKLIYAGGMDLVAGMNSVAEDDEAQALADINAANLRAGDCAIFVSASGETPYTLAALRHLKSQGLKAIALANNEQCSLLQEADIGIYLSTPAEVVAGSTRMGAGTAQKIALNMFSTLMGVHLGHIYDGMMVNVIADNDKLRGRAMRMICEIADCDQDKALNALDDSGGDVKLAILRAKAGMSIEDARIVLAVNTGNLRLALG